jgi:hypothetical protein
LLCFHDIQSKQRIKRDVSSIKDIKRAKKWGEYSLLFPWSKAGFLPVLGTETTRILKKAISIVDEVMSKW